MDAYVRELALSGSHFRAAEVATPFKNDRQAISERAGGTTPPSGYSTFARERKVNPVFRERCEEALRVAIGRAEAEVTRRMFLPTERVTLNPKTGSVAHVSFDYRNADALLSRFLSKNSPDWIEKKHLDSTSTININNADAPSGMSYTFRSTDVELLSVDERAQLANLIRAIEDRREVIDVQQVTPNALPTASENQ